MDGDKLNGVIAMDMRTGNLLGVAAKTVIIATGGYGRVYWIRTSNPYSSTGDGIVAGMNIGIIAILPAIDLKRIFLRTRRFFLMAVLILVSLYGVGFCFAIT